MPDVLGMDKIKQTV